MEIQITKMHGLGNSYVVIEDINKKHEKMYADLARIISDKNFGIGSDGLLVVNRGRAAKYHMRIFNPDGSEAELSGNGARIFARYLYENRMIGKNTKIEAGGKKGGRIIEVSINKSDSVTVGMGKGKIISKKTINANGKRFSGLYVEVGNPHFVTFVSDEKTARQNAELYGNAIEHHNAFKPQGVNVEFANMKNKRDLVLHVWERGAGITSACGTGSCAAAFAAFKRMGAANTMRVRLVGGSLLISIKDDDTIMMRGPVGRIFSGTLYLDGVTKNRV